MFFKKSKHKVFAKIIISTPSEVIRENAFTKIWTEEEKLFFNLELSFLMLFISAPKLRKKEDMMLLEKELVNALMELVPGGIRPTNITFSDIIRNRFQQYRNACHNDKEGNYAQALEAVFFGFFVIDCKENMLKINEDDLSSKISITAATNRTLFAMVLNEIYSIVEKRIKP